MSAKYLLDTNICGFMLRNMFSVKEAIQKVGLSNCAISELTMFELKVGAQITLQKDNINQDRKLSYLFDAVDILPINDAFDFAAKEKARLRLLGKPIGDDFDLLIGCTSVVHNMVMVTENIKHFQNIRNIVLENWVQR